MRLLAALLFAAVAPLGLASSVAAYYRPDVMLVPASLSVPVSVARAQSTGAPVPPAAARGPRLRRASADNAADPNSALLGELLTPLRTVMLRLLHRAQVRLDGATSEDIANILRGPIADLKNYLISIWPDTPSLLPSPPPTSAMPHASQ